MEKDYRNMDIEQLKEEYYEISKILEEKIKSNGLVALNVAIGLSNIPHERRDLVGRIIFLENFL